ncbi:winged helix-turn-helix domain-containing protein [uncultured Oscillibacter sp.]|uniref:winged helix-turn-helix domain-containing protein n=1 Tax=uncultured Oscillibacter sp. TaxID=876091 RepID=UPI0025DD3B12|nr:winged helix-turn-helix domain-containing protein [uncultured Oscillibacter sp.]
MDRRDAMQRDKGLHRLLYEYYEAQIRFGYYRRGDSLPPISAICAAFRLGRTTVRSALAMLEAEGLVETGARRPARVVFQADAAQVAETAARYFAPRKAGILDLLAAERLLAVPF